MRLMAVFACVMMLVCIGSQSGHAAADGWRARNTPSMVSVHARVARKPDNLSDFISDFGNETGMLVRVAQKANQATTAPGLTPAEVERLFKVFVDVFRKIQTDYIEKPDDAKLLRAAVDAMQAAFPDTQAMSAVGSPPAETSKIKPGSLNSVYATALRILNARTSRADDAALVTVAINGMLAALDSKSSYMDAKSFRDAQVQSRGQFGGVGLEVSMDKGLVKVVSPIEDAPAERAGILANDLITHIDNQPVAGLTLDQAVEKMRGPVNTRIKLTIVRAGEDKPIEITLARDIIRVRAVRARLEGDDIGIIRLTQFNEQTTDLLKKALADLSARSGPRLKGFILDLRNNSGGLLDQAILVCDSFLEKGEIVSTRGRKAGESQRFTARAGDLASGAPLIVLIDGGTAAASEIVAGALQDHLRASVIGARSFGDGSVRTIIPLGAGNGALRLVTSRFFTPSGRVIEGNGITPDIEIDQQPPEQQQSNAQGAEQKRARSYVPLDPRDDKVLQAALARIRSAASNSANPANSSAESGR